MISLGLILEKGWKDGGSPVVITSKSACPFYFNIWHLVTSARGTGMNGKSLEVECLE